MGIFVGERFVNLEMVRDGFAWRYVQYDEPGVNSRRRKPTPASTVAACGLIAIKNHLRVATRKTSKSPFRSLLKIERKQLATL
jgi:hypothetical protein